MRKFFVLTLVCLVSLACEWDFWNDDDNKGCDRYILHGTLQNTNYAPLVDFVVRIVDLENLVTYDTRTDGNGTFIIAELLVKPSSETLQIYVEGTGYRGYLPDPYCPECSLSFAEWDDCYYKMLITIKQIVNP